MQRAIWIITFFIILAIGYYWIVVDESRTESMIDLASSDNKLSEEDKVKYNTAFTMLNAHRKYGSPEVVHKVERAIKERKEPLALKEFIKEFNKKNHSK